jgi:formylmethanofuran dehydrogenase subunit D
MSESTNVILISGRTIAQGTTRDGRKTLKEYVDSCAICEVDPEDLGKLQIKEGDIVKVTTNYGTVAVRAVASTQAPHSGIVFIPMGPWANEVIGPETDGVGMPSFKSVLAEIAAAPTETILDAVALVRRR